MVISTRKATLIEDEKDAIRVNEQAPSFSMGYATRCTPPEDRLRNYLWRIIHSCSFVRRTAQHPAQLVEGDGFRGLTLGPAACAYLLRQPLLVAPQRLQLLPGDRLVQPGSLFAGHCLVEEACGRLLHQRDLLPQGQIAPLNPCCERGSRSSQLSKLTTH